MATTRIDSMIARVRTLEWESNPRYLKKRLDVLWARLRVSDTHSTYQSPWYVDPTEAYTLIVEDYDKMLMDVYQHLSYLIALDIYTRDVTNNRWYYCRKKQQTYMYLTATYTNTPRLLYTMWDYAWWWFFDNPYTRQPLNTALFYYLISLQDDGKKI